MQEKQKTLNAEVVVTGKGLHTGLDVTAKLKPAPAGHGIVFQRVDVEGKPLIPALAEYVTGTARGTTLELNGVKISTIEHMLAALTGLGVDNVMIEINAPEVPIIDGSSKPFVNAIKTVGTKELDQDRQFYYIKEKTIFRDETHGNELVAYPDDTYTIDVHVDYNSSFLSNQYATYNEKQDFDKELAHCKTFVFLGELEPLFKNNLIKGGDLDNAIIIVDKEYPQEYYNSLAALFNKPKVEARPEGVLNNVELLYKNEPARHKLLDVIGDLTLIGMPLKGRVIATKPGHKVNTDFAKLIRKKIKSQE
jgi:UDP-3-O-[3-hydroxymyristoyl] N-acetylglucosamine deacetylase / 3-hydroxyacyl-[acyl-carrier-protein] dehydratase